MAGIAEMGAGFVLHHIFMRINLYTHVIDNYMSIVLTVHPYIRGIGAQAREMPQVLPAVRRVRNWQNPQLRLVAEYVPLQCDVSVPLRSVQRLSLGYILSQSVRP